MTELLSGRDVAAAMEADLQKRVAACRSAGVDPTLCLFRAGDDPSAASYERGVTKRAAAIGLNVVRMAFGEDATQAELEAAVRQVGEDGSIHGCLVFNPLPAHVDAAAVCDSLVREKDVDGASAASLSSVFSGRGRAFAPSTPAACMKVLDHYGVPLAGARVTVVGRSLVVGRPLAMLLLERDATPCICHSKTRDLPALMREADVVVCAAGRARAFGRECFREGQVVLDVGINFADGRLCGDVDFDAVSGLVAAITPVPGGIGSVTSSITLEHTIEAAERRCAR